MLGRKKLPSEQGSDGDRLRGDAVRLGWQPPVPLPTTNGHAVPMAAGATAGPVAELVEQPPRESPEERRERSRRRTLKINGLISTAATVLVATIAGYISWLHLFALGMAQPVTTGLSATQEEWAARLTPFSIDGMIVVGTLKLRQARLEQRTAHWAAYAAVILGVAGTIAGNVASAPDATWARILAAGPPTAFLLTVEALFGRPLSKNLWELIRDWARRGQAKREARRESRQVKASAATPARAQAKPKPQVEAPIPDKGPEKPVEPLTPPASRSASSKPRTPASVSKGRPALTVVTRGPQRDLDDLVVGTRANPARRVGETVLEGEELRADARRRIAARLAQRVAEGMSPKEARDGLGAWASREYTPPMGERWGQERVKEVPDPEPVGVTE